MRWYTMLLTLCLAFAAEHCAAASDVREETLMLPIQIGSQSEQVEALIVRPVEGDKFPIALIVNGSSGSYDPKDVRADWLAHIAHDFAQRGWLAVSIVWPGYGKSTGTFMRDGGNCLDPHVGAFLDAHADELAAVLKALQTRPDADPLMTLGVGFSIGGMSILDLAARSDHPLTAAINISGGVYYGSHPGIKDPDCTLHENDLVSTVAKFGKRSTTPSLWIYAENDPFFPPALAERLLSTYRSEGGKADFVMLPPFGTDGHTLYKQEATPLLKGRINDFLHANHLRTSDESAFAALLARLSGEQRASAEMYLASSSEKAMAAPKDGKEIYWFYGARSSSQAREQALNECRKATGKSCRIVAQNTSLVKGWETVGTQPPR